MTTFSSRQFFNHLHLQSSIASWQHLNMLVVGGTLLLLFVGLWRLGSVWNKLWFRKNKNKSQDVTKLKLILSGIIGIIVLVER